MRKHNPRHLRVWIPDPRSVDNLASVRKDQSTMKIPAVWRALWYLVLLAVLTLVIALYTLTWSRGDVLREYRLGLGGGWSKPSSNKNTTVDAGEGQAELSTGVHPIDHLMHLATKAFDKMVNNEIHTLEQAAAQYRKLRGRHPPPGFTAWYKFAKAKNAIINERFWDQIYHDLGPFWSSDPVLLRKQAHVFSPKISIRNGQVEAKSHNQHSKLGIWEDMLKTLTSDTHVKLPDIDIPLNVNNEPAMLVPWEAIDTALSMSRKIMLEPADIISHFSDPGDIDNLTTGFEWKPEWLGARLTYPSSHLGPRPLWSLVRPACAPRTPTRLEHVYNDIWDSKQETKEEHKAASLIPSDLPEGTLKGYTRNWTTAIDACRHPHLQGLHAEFVSPNEMGIANKLFPLFGDTKFAMSNEISLPGAVDWNATSSPIEPATSWDDRKNKLFWRGTATDSQESERHWQRFQRERLVTMLNATHVEIAEASIHSGNESTVGVGYAKNFKLLPANEYHLKSQTGASLAEWVNGWADAGFVDLKCGNRDGEVCAYLDEYFSVTPPASPEHVSDYKFAIKLDDYGDSDSNSFLREMHSSKVSLRASIYRNWYDSRLIPWLHFIPIDNTFVDLYGVMEYFLGTGISEEAKVFSHAVGEVQKHDHHFKTPGGTEKAIDNDGQGSHHDTTLPPVDHSSSSQSGNEPHLPSSVHQHPPSKRSVGTAHDASARRVAEASKQWADKVLRKEDMLVYVYRLLLEYARIMDDKRERLGWVGDLTE